MNIFNGSGFMVRRRSSTGCARTGVFPAFQLWRVPPAPHSLTLPLPVPDGSGSDVWSANATNRVNLKPLLAFTNSYFRPGRQINFKSIAIEVMTAVSRILPLLHREPALNGGKIC